jgi:hypothetical protein
MLFLVSNAQQRPNMLEGPKDEKYHLEFGRYAVGQANNQKHIDFLDNLRRNKNFYSGKQWTLDEDLEAFFKDDTNQSRNRIKVINNVIRPMVENYRGNAIRMRINARAKSISPLAVTRREQSLQKMLFFSRIANEEGNPYADDLKKKLPIGNSDSETEDTFNNIYTDKYTETINELLEYVSDRNRFEAKQLKMAEDLALGGICIVKDFESGGHQYFKNVAADTFFWDRSGVESDLSDAEFMGEEEFCTEAEIYETAQNITQDDRKAIQTFVQSFSNANVDSASNIGTTTFGVDSKYNYGGRIPAFNVVWKDTEKYEYGYVKDQFGYPYLTKINFIEEGADAPTYTDKDLIEVDSVRSRRILGGRKKRSIYVDIVRFVRFVPKEILMSAPGQDKDKTGDIVLEHGILPYQETDNVDVSDVKYPYKCSCWAYVDGEVLSPVDDAISPQRMINRILSVAENQINNSRGAGTFYDKSMIDPNGGEDEILRNMNQSKPVGINAKGRGIQNAVSSYDGTIKQGSMVLFNIVDLMSNYTQKMTGVNDALKGESTGSDQLVGVTQLMIQRGSLMQEPFYNSITEVFMQCYQSVASRGVKIYADNERELAIAVGDNGAKILKITKDMKYDVFRVFIKRENPEEVLINAGDQMLMQYLQLGLIDKDQFANMQGRFTPDMISSAMRIKALEDREIGKMEAAKQQEEQAVIAQQADAEKQMNMQMMNEAVARDDIKDLQDKRHEEKMTTLKNMGSIAKVNKQAQNQIMTDAKNLQNQGF